MSHSEDEQYHSGEGTEEEVDIHSEESDEDLEAAAQFAAQVEAQAELFHALDSNDRLRRLWELRERVAGLIQYYTEDNRELEVDGEVHDISHLITLTDVLEFLLNLHQANGVNPAVNRPAIEYVLQRWDSNRARIAWLEARQAKLTLDMQPHWHAWFN